MIVSLMPSDFRFEISAVGCRMKILAKRGPGIYFGDKGHHDIVG